MSKLAHQRAYEQYPQGNDGNSARIGYTLGYDQAFQDFVEKAEKWLEKELLVSDIEHKKYWLMTEENKSNFIEDFKNYMQNE